MAKAQLTLYIDTDLKEMAKSSGFNLSQEFEEWMRIRMNQNNKDDKDSEEFDYNKEYARLRMEMERLESKKELRLKQEYKDKERIMILDSSIDNEMQYSKPSEISEKRFRGVKFLFKQKFNEQLTDDQAKELISNRIKERKLCDNVESAKDGSTNET